MMFNTTLMSSKTYTFLKGQDNKKSSVTVFLKTPVQFPDNWISGFMRPWLLKVSQRYAQATSQGMLISYVDLWKYHSISKFDNQTMNRQNNEDTTMLLVTVELTATLLHLFLPSEYHSLTFNESLITALSTYYDPHQSCSIDKTNIHPFSHLLWWIELHSSQSIYWKHHSSRLTLLKHNVNFFFASLHWLSHRTLNLCMAYDNLRRTLWLLSLWILYHH